MQEMVRVRRRVNMKGAREDVRREKRRGKGWGWGREREARRGMEAELSFYLAFDPTYSQNSLQSSPVHYSDENT
jgi:hypothetical protein